MNMMLSIRVIGIYILFPKECFFAVKASGREEIAQSLLFNHQK
jgi:hypothetical protein